MKAQSFILCVIIALSITLASSLRLNQGPYGGDGQDIIEFLEGIAEGLEIDFGNVTQCTSDLNITLDDFEDSWRDLKYGMDHLSKSYIEQGLKGRS